MTRAIALYLLALFNRLFTTKRLLQIVVILSATVAMKWLSNGYEFSWLTALAGQ